METYIFYTLLRLFDNASIIKAHKCSLDFDCSDLTLPLVDDLSRKLPATALIELRDIASRVYQLSTDNEYIYDSTYDDTDEF